jgi:hypothetical protein
MRITLDVPDYKAAFMLELLRSLPFVTLRGRVAKVAALDETAYLLASPANAARLRAALERDKLGQHKTHSLPD